MVVFKRPKRNAARGVISSIGKDADDSDQVVWSTDSKTPYFITINLDPKYKKVAGEVTGVKTYTSRIKRLRV